MGSTLDTHVVGATEARSTGACERAFSVLT